MYGLNKYTEKKEFILHLHLFCWKHPNRSSFGLFIGIIFSLPSFFLEIRSRPLRIRYTHTHESYKYCAQSMCEHQFDFLNICCVCIYYVFTDMNVRVWTSTNVVTTSTSSTTISNFRSFECIVYSFIFVHTSSWNTNNSCITVCAHRVWILLLLFFFCRSTEWVCVCVGISNGSHKKERRSALNLTNE